VRIDFFLPCLFGRRSVSDEFAGTPSDAKIDALLETQFGAGRLYAAISSRPGQVGRSDGYILEGKELEVSWNLDVAEIINGKDTDDV
jgi:Ribosomal protein S8e